MSLVIVYSPTGYPFKVLELDNTLADNDIYEQRRRRKQGIGRYHTGQQSLLKSHAATEILWKLDEKDQKDVTESGKYSAGRLGGKNLFMQLTNVAPDCNKAYSFTMSQQLDAFTNFGNQNPSTLPPQVPSPPPGSPVGSPRFPPSPTTDVSHRGRPAAAAWPSAYLKPQ